MASEPIGQFIKLVSLLCQNDLFSMLHTVSEQLALLHGPGKLLLLTNNVPCCLCLIKLCTGTGSESCLIYKKEPPTSLEIQTT